MRRLALSTALVLLLVLVPAAHGAPAGNVKLLKHADSGFDGDLTSAWSSTSRRDTIRRSYERMRVYAPFFDRHVGWYKGAWAYQDLYAVYTDDRRDPAARRYVLEDALGRPLYIPWGCSGGTCPQYAAHPGDPRFRARWIAEAREKLAAGYRGLWVDDANLVPRIGNGSGDEVLPIDPLTGNRITERAWKRYVVEFLEQIRRAFPRVEIVHNSLWWAGPTSDPLVRRQIAAADYVSVEHAFSDAGLTGGRGHVSYAAYLRYMDTVHRMGRALVLESNNGIRGERSLLAAGYLMASNGRDLLASSSGTDPGKIWPGFRARLGPARGKRYRWRGVWRRDFRRGTALLSDPGSRRRRLPLRGRTPAGKKVRSVTLGDRDGAVVLRGRR